MNTLMTSPLPAEQRITDRPGQMLNVCGHGPDAASYYLHFYDREEDVANKVKVYYEYANCVAISVPVLHFSNYLRALHNHDPNAVLIFPRSRKMEDIVSSTRKLAGRPDEGAVAPSNTPLLVRSDGSLLSGEIMLRLLGVLAALLVAFFAYLMREQHQDHQQGEPAIIPVELRHGVRSAPAILAGVQDSMTSVTSDSFDAGGFYHKADGVTPATRGIDPPESSDSAPFDSIVPDGFCHGADGVTPATRGIDPPNSSASASLAISPRLLVLFFPLCRQASSPWEYRFDDRMVSRRLLLCVRLLQDRLASE